MSSPTASPAPPIDPGDALDALVELVSSGEEADIADAVLRIVADTTAAEDQFADKAAKFWQTAFLLGVHRFLGASFRYPWQGRKKRTIHVRKLRAIEAIHTAWGAGFWRTLQDGGVFLGPDPSQNILEQLAKAARHASIRRFLSVLQPILQSGPDSGRGKVKIADNGQPILENRHLTAANKALNNLSDDAEVDQSPERGRGTKEVEEDNSSRLDSPRLESSRLGSSRLDSSRLDSPLQHSPLRHDSSSPRESPSPSPHASQHSGEFTPQRPHKRLRYSKSASSISDQSADSEDVSDSGSHHTNLEDDGESGSHHTDLEDDGESVLSPEMSPRTPNMAARRSTDAPTPLQPAYLSITEHFRQKHEAATKLLSLKEDLRLAEDEVTSTKTSIGEFNINPPDADNISGHIADLENRFQRDEEFFERAKALAAEFNKDEHDKCVSVCYDDEQVHNKLVRDQAHIDCLVGLKTRLERACAAHQTARQAVNTATGEIIAMNAQLNDFLAFSRDKQNEIEKMLHG